MVLSVMQHAIQPGSLTPMGRKRRGPKPLTFHKQVKAELEWGGRVLALFVEIQWVLDPYGQLANEELQRRIEKEAARIRGKQEELTQNAYLKLLRWYRERHLDEIGRRAINGYWMLRACGWNGDDDEVWNWWQCVGYEDRMELWRLTRECFDIARE